MNKGSSDNVTPWFKQFWPWFLIALPATVVVAGLYTLVLANQYADDLVVDDYYKEGLAINRQLKRQQAASELGISAELSMAGRQLSVQVSGTVDAAQLRLLLSHPLEADRDFAIPLIQQAAGVYNALLPQALQGRWHWTIDKGDGSAWRIDGEQTF